MAKPPRLSAAQLPTQQQIVKPSYDRAELRSGIVHIGVGGFHRAHQAVYTDEVLKSGNLEWGITGVNMHSDGMRTKLEPQNGLYTVATKPNEGPQALRVIGSITELHCTASSDGYAKVIARIASAECQVLTFTVTEKGYCLRGGKLDLEHSDIQHDQNPSNQPASMPGLIAAALAQRASEHGLPLTLLSCDNLANNGAVLQNVVLTMVALRFPEALTWAQQNVSFPSSMVDRIVPQTTPQDFQNLEKSAGYQDAGLVTCEPFSQWVIADQFAGARPPWDMAGAEFVADVAPFERCKLSMLNATHSALAYLGLLCGHEFIHQTMADAQLRKFAAALLNQEIAPTLLPPPSLDLAKYQTQILSRFANQNVPYTTLQVASDGSQKLSQRILPTIESTLKQGMPHDRLCLVVAAWLQCLTGTDDQGELIAINDPMAADLISWRAGLSKKPTALETVQFTASQTPHLGRLADNPAFTQTLANMLNRLQTDGAMATVGRLLEGD